MRRSPASHSIFSRTSPERSTAKSSGRSVGTVQTVLPAAAVANSGRWSPSRLSPDCRSLAMALANSFSARWAAPGGVPAAVGRTATTRDRKRESAASRRRTITSDPSSRTPARNPSVGMWDGGRSNAPVESACQTSAPFLGSRSSRSGSSSQGELSTTRTMSAPWTTIPSWLLHTRRSPFSPLGAAMAVDRPVAGSRKCSRVESGPWGAYARTTRPSGRKAALCTTRCDSLRWTISPEAPYQIASIESGTITKVGGSATVHLGAASRLSFDHWRLSRTSTGPQPSGWSEPAGEHPADANPKPHQTARARRTVTPRPPPAPPAGAPADTAP